VKKTDEGQPVVVGRAMNTPRESASALMTVLQDQPGEVFAILCLSTKHRVIAYHEVSRGTLDATLIHPREVFKAALLAIVPRSSSAITTPAATRVPAQTTSN
jgi:DNA repair protein RadC